MALFLAGGCKEDKGGFIVVVNPGAQPPIVMPTPRPEVPSTGTMIDFSFRNSVPPWVAVFADYPVDRASIVRPAARQVTLPPELGTGDGLLLSGQGDPNGLFTGVWRRVEGLRPYTSYRVDFSVTLASNLARGCGDPTRAGDVRIVKAGAGSVPPEPTGSTPLRLPLDKGTPTGSGRNMVAVGDLAIPQLSACSADHRFHLKTLRSDDKGPIVATDSVGRLWLILGVETGPDIAQRYYILDGRFTLSRAW